MKLIVGTRGSRLAMTQTNWVIHQLKAIYNELQFEVKIIKTKGDKIQDVSLDKIGDKGLFVKEIEEALLAGTIDMAIHSMKDMPSKLPDGLTLTSPPMREVANDILITPHRVYSLDDLVKGAVIGTGSKRRKYQLLAYRNDYKIEPIRGNIDTRIRKMLENKLDGIVLAEAGISRLGLNHSKDYYCYRIPRDIMIPACTQGILAIELKKDRKNLIQLINEISDETTQIQSRAERSFLNAVNGSCHIPVGAYCHINEDEIVLTGLLGLEDGSNLVKHTMRGKKEEAEVIGERLAKFLIKEVY